MIDFQQILIAMEYGLKGLPTTIYLSLLSMVIGTILGLVVGLVQSFNVPILASLFKFMVIIFRGIPAILIILVIYFYGSNLMHYLNRTTSLQFDTSQISTINICLVAFIIIATTRASEIFRGAFFSINIGQIEAAKSLGYTQMQALKDIYLTQMFAIACPMLANLAIGLVKISALASVIAVVEVLQSSLIPATLTFSFLESYIGAGIILWGLAILIEIIFNYIERKTRLYITMEG